MTEGNNRAEASEPTEKREAEQPENEVVEAEHVAQSVEAPPTKRGRGRPRKERSQVVEADPSAVTGRVEEIVSEMDGVPDRTEAIKSANEKAKRRKPKGTQKAQEAAAAETIYAVLRAGLALVPKRFEATGDPEAEAQSLAQVWAPVAAPYMMGDTGEPSRNTLILIGLVVTAQVAAMRYLAIREILAKEKALEISPVPGYDTAAPEGRTIAPDAGSDVEPGTTGEGTTPGYDSVWNG